ncbi:MAG: metallophosphoesterase [Anaerolineales bacterium]|nr:metallophosphoesterase [Anaerolineales bacterium]
MMNLLRRCISLLVLCLLAGISLSFRSAPAEAESPDSFTFAVTADMREYAGPGAYDTSQYFRGAMEAIAAHGPTVFMVSPGDIDPPANVYWTITQTLGLDYPWYPVVGNHETETPEDMVWLRAFEYGMVNPGPAGCPTTTYSFDHGSAHFVVLNEYCDQAGDTATSGDVPDYLYDWLAADLEATNQDLVFVFGHEPAFPQPDADNGRLRHEYDSLNQFPDNRDRFWSLLQDYRVAAYICGHTHNYSAVKIDGVWQLDAGHSRGLGDTGARSTFILVYVQDGIVTYDTYRDDAAGGAYLLMDHGLLAGLLTYLPFMVNR